METKRRTLLGIILVLVGLVLLLDNLHLIPGLPHYVFHWANIFLVIAVINLFSGNRKPAFIFLVIWAFFTLDRYYYVDFEDYWPLIIVAVGISFIIKNKASGVSGTSENYFDDINIFGGSNKRITSQNFEGGKSTNIFGGSTIDLRESKPVDGATIQVFTMFGGCDIIAPPEWDMIIDTTSIFGAFDDKRESSNAKTDYKIYVKGFALFGGGSLKSAK
ncbi:LiaF transmembrane domain-containing protein [Marinoscillum sp.]|uniref:LiaF transmembrane domain-containing protein n=1 Tax=Marinoscillum sp. TaxID=2024838 RepID=UPI003BAA6872